MTDRVHYRSLMHDSARWEHFVLRHGDVVVSTPPKAGTTWTQTICLMLLHNTVDLPAPVSKLSPWLDQQVLAIDDVVEALDAQSGRRVIKTHTPLDGLPFVEGVAYVCVARDPLDMAMSMVDHQGNLDMDRVLELRATAVGNDDLAEFGPRLEAPRDSMQRLHDWICGDPPYSLSSLRRALHHWDTFWQVADDPRIGLLHYGDLRHDRVREVAYLAALFGLEPNLERDMAIVAATDFEVMRSQAARFAPNASVRMWRNDEAFFRAGRRNAADEVLDTELLATYHEVVAEQVSPQLAEWVHHGRRAGPT